MDSVNPVILVAAGTAVVGIAVAMGACLRGSDKSVEASSKKTERRVVEPVTQQEVKPKKKAKKAKSVEPPVVVPLPEKSIDEIYAEVEGASSTKGKKNKKAANSKDTKSKPTPAAAPASTLASAKLAPVAEPEPEPEPEVEAPSASAPSSESVEDESKRAKKPKETPEQKAARMERQRVARAQEAEALAALAATSTTAHFEVFSDHAAIVADGWAVVEEKRKLKSAKKPAAAATTAAASAAVASVAEPAGPIDSVKEMVTVEAKKMGIIIGPKGATLKATQDATGTTISTPKDKDSKAAVAVVEVTGPAAGVAMAVRVINDLCVKGYAPLLEGEDFSEGHVSVHPMNIPDIIGKSGSIRKAIQDFTGVRVIIPPNVDRDQVTNVKVLLAGQRMKVSEAKKLIKELIRVNHTEATHPGFVHEELDIAAPLYNFIIGSRGSEIRHIEGNFKVSVYIPNERSQVKNVLVVGLPVNVEAAVRYIHKIIERATRDREATVAAADAFVAAATEAPTEEWMNQYVHPSKRAASTPASTTASAAPAAATTNAWAAASTTEVW